MKMMLLCAAAMVVLSCVAADTVPPLLPNQYSYGRSVVILLLWCVDLVVLFAVVFILFSGFVENVTELSSGQSQLISGRVYMDFQVCVCVFVLCVPLCVFAIHVGLDVCLFAIH